MYNYDRDRYRVGKEIFILTEGIQGDVVVFDGEKGVHESGGHILGGL
jgi:hypothetical protein